METKGYYDFGVFRVDGWRKCLTRNGELLPLSAKAFDVLYALLQEPGRTISKDDLMKQVWPDTFVEEGNLTQMIFLLRKALGDAEGGQSLILTVPRQGYRFTGEVTAERAEKIRASAMARQPRSPVNDFRWIGGAIATVIISGAAGWLMATYGSPKTILYPGPIVYRISPQRNESFSVGKVSPDGRSIALMGVNTEGKRRIWVRRLDSLVAQPLSDADFWPFWSPDSQFVVFAHDGKLQKMKAAGGIAQTICDTELVIGGSWNREGTIIFGDGTAISRVSSQGGAPQRVTQLDSGRGETTHDFPVFLPDGRHFLYTIHSAKRENGGVFAGSLDSPATRIRLLADVTYAEYSATKPGYLLFARGDAVMAQQFSPEKLTFTGEAVPIANGTIIRDPSNLTAPFSSSETGVLLITSGYRGDQVTWFDRSGHSLGTIGRPGLHFYGQLSPDEKTVVIDELDPERFLSDVWLFPASPGGAASRLTFDGQIRPIWYSDGSRIAFEAANTSLFSKSFAGTDNQELLLEGHASEDDDRLPCESSKDGRFLLYSQRSPKTGYDLWLLPLSGDRIPVSLLDSEHNEGCGSVSPDGKWLAYASDESGRNEIYVQAFSTVKAKAASSRKWQVSDTGGSWPKWRGDGRELLYLANDRVITGVMVNSGAGFQHGAPQRLFASGIRTPDARFDVTRDGQRFIIPARVTEERNEPVTLIVNWTQGLKP